MRTAVGLLMLFAVGWGLAAAFDWSRGGREPTIEQQIGRNFRRIEMTEDLVRVRMHTSSSHWLFVTGLGSLAKEALRPLADRGLVRDRDVEIVIEGPLVDRYGRTTVEPLVTMEFRRADLAKVQWGGITSEMLVRLALVSRIAPAVLKPIREWCGSQTGDGLIRPCGQAMIHCPIPAQC